MEFAVFILIAFLILTIVSGTYVFILACVRRKELPWLVEEEIKKTSFGKYYDYIVASNQWLIEHDAKDIYVTSEDGLRLHGLWIPAENPKGTILFAHGYRSTFLVDFGAAFSFYHERGMNLLIPDQRAHGKSQGRFITFGVKESGNMLKWLDYHNNTFGHFPVVLSGISMGASTMLYLADRSLPENVCGIIADCGFTSPKDIVCEVFHRVIHLPAVPSIWVADLLARLFAGFSFYEKDSRKTLTNCRIPILMVHGKEDGFVPCKMTVDGFAACSGIKEILLVEGADHGLSFVKDPEHYVQAIVIFLEKYLRIQ